MHCTRSNNVTDVVYWYAKPLCLIDWGVYLHPRYMHCTRSSNFTDLVYRYARPLCSIDWGVYLHPRYLFIVLDPAISLIWSTGMQGLSAQLTGGVYLHPIYMHCTRSSNFIDLVYRYARPLCSIDWGVYLHPRYLFIVLDPAI